MAITRLLLISLLCLSSCSTKQPDLLTILRTKGLIQADHVLVHLSHTCNLTSGATPLQVIDIRELGKTASSPRGINHIAIFTTDWTLVQDIPYVDQRPLFCQGSRLVLYNTLAIRNELPEGNVLDFQDNGRKIVFSQVDPNTLPTLGESNGFPQLPPHVQ